VSEFYHEFKGEKREERAVMSFRTTKRRYQIKVQFFLRISIKTNVVLYTVSTLREKEFAQTPLSFSFSLFLSLFLFVRRRSWGLVVATNFTIRVVITICVFIVAVDERKTFRCALKKGTSISLLLSRMLMAQEQR
jgi:hypothetical protein